MKSFEVDFSEMPEFDVGTPDIRYNIMEYNNFQVREVVKNGKEIGEFHFKFTIGIPTYNKNNIIMINNIIKPREIDWIDPGDILGLEYKIYFKYDTDSMEYEAIDDLLTYLDDNLTKALERKHNG